MEPAQGSEVHLHGPGCTFCLRRREPSSGSKLSLQHLMDLTFGLLLSLLSWACLPRSEKSCLEVICWPGALLKVTSKNEAINGPGS